MATISHHGRHQFFTVRGPGWQEGCQPSPFLFCGAWFGRAGFSPPVFRRSAFPRRASHCLSGTILSLGRMRPASSLQAVCPSRLRSGGGPQAAGRGLSFWRASRLAALAAARIPTPHRPTLPCPEWPRGLESLRAGAIYFRRAWAARGLDSTFVVSLRSTRTWQRLNILAWI